MTRIREQAFKKILQIFSRALAAYPLVSLAMCLTWGGSLGFPILSGDVVAALNRMLKHSKGRKNVSFKCGVLTPGGRCILLWNFKC